MLLLLLLLLLLLPVVAELGTMMIMIMMLAAVVQFMRPITAKHTNDIIFAIITSQKRFSAF
jgi:hypothetical protein